LGDFGLLHQLEPSSKKPWIWLTQLTQIKVFKIVAPSSDIDYFATNDLKMRELQRLKRLQSAEFEWSIEQYHLHLKPGCVVKKAQEHSQRIIIGLAIRAFLRLDMYWFNTSISLP
jgi:putative transposase